MGFFSNFFDRKEVEKKGKEMRQILDEVPAILLPRVNGEGNPDFQEITFQNPSPINIVVRIYDYQASMTERPDLMDVKKKAYSTYLDIYPNDIILVDNQDYTVLVANRDEDNGEVVLYLK